MVLEMLTFTNLCRVLCLNKALTAQHSWGQPAHELTGLSFAARRERPCEPESG